MPYKPNRPNPTHPGILSQVQQLSTPTQTLPYPNPYLAQAMGQDLESDLLSMSNRLTAQRSRKKDKKSPSRGNGAAASASATRAADDPPSQGTTPPPEGAAPTGPPQATEDPEAPEG